MRSRVGRSTALAVVVLAATAVAGGALAAIAAHGTARAATTKVTVTETDYAIAPSIDTVSPGKVTFTVTNSGAVAHKFGIKGNGVNKKILGLIKPGATKSVTVVLKKKGTYTLFCPLHQAQGMTATFTVAAAPSGTTTNSTTGGTTTTHWA